MRLKFHHKLNRFLNPSGIVNDRSEHHTHPSVCKEAFVARRVLFFLGVLVFLFFISSPLRAQQANPSGTFTDTQREGRRIFQQRCAVCHTPPTVVAKRYGPALYKEIVEDNEDTIRDTIMEGREALMPGFKYGLTRPEIDSIIEYLKTVKRPSSRPNNNRTADNPERNSGGETN
jgi:mono/diheme cytochrome c family protein